jgi:hypothetical protein
VTSPAGPTRNMGRVVWRAKNLSCGYCGETFDGKLHGPRPIYCSPACRQAAYRDRHGIGRRAQPHRRTTSARKAVGYSSLRHP